MYPWLIPDWHALSQTAQSGRLGHAWLLLGNPGLGKEQLAERLARLHLCQQPDRGEPCGHCHSCQLFDKGNHPDLGTITRDSKTIGVEAIREISLPAAGLCPARPWQGGDHSRCGADDRVGGQRPAENPGRAGRRQLAVAYCLPGFPVASHHSQSLSQTCLSVACGRGNSTLVGRTGSSGHSGSGADLSGAPLRVLDYIEQQQDGTRRELLEQFVALSQSPVKATALCSQLGQETQVRLHWLQLFLCDALKTQAGCGHHQLAMPDLAILSQRLAEQHSSEKLLEAEQDLVALKAACQPGQLSNPTIHLMNWLSRWL